MKKILSIALVVVLLAGIAVSGTMAYLTDTDSAVNVMTLGNVNIEQIEQERDAKGELQDFTQDKPAYPAVYEGSSIPWADGADWPVENDEAWKVVADNENVVDKFVTVKNTGKSDAYVRTLIAFEVGKDAVNDPYMHLVCNGNKDGIPVTYEWVKDAAGNEIVIEVDGGYYKVCAFTYTDALPAGETSIPSIKQVYLDKTATNEVCEAYGETFEILALSQAVQTEGFENAAAALDTAFGVVNAENAAEWFNGVWEQNSYEEEIDDEMTVLTIDNFDEFKQFDVAVDNNGEFKGVKVANNTNVYVKLNTDIDLSQYTDFTGIGNGNGNSFDGVFNGYGHTIKNWTVNTNWSYYMALFRTTANMDVKNLTIENFNLGTATTKGTNYGVVIGAVGGTDVLVENVTVKNAVIKTQRTLGAVVGGITNGRLTISNCTVENVELHNAGNDVPNNRVAGVFLGNGWSHHDAEADGVFLSNNTYTNVKWFAGGAEQTTVPEYTYNK